jgi:predicted PhzF superfamily epimerase YddE/YHI9
MRIPYYEVAAFAERPFAGNPAGVCLPAEPLPDALMQRIAAENNLSETAFLVPEGEAWRLRWFTPAVEVDLCGHATLATAHVLWREQGVAADRLVFRTKGGEVAVDREGDRLVLDFPARPPRVSPPPAGLFEALGARPREFLRARDGLCVFASEGEVAVLRPDFRALARLDLFAVIATAPGHREDFVSRFFAPAAGVDEDPVTGSAHSTLIPFWAERLGRPRLRARQISARGGELGCELRGGRVGIGGHAVTYLRGELDVPAA